jgi:hypothetical protein
MNTAPDQTRDLFILWGADIDQETKPSHYHFESQAAVEAFWMDVNEADGLSIRFFPTFQGSIPEK